MQNSRVEPSLRLPCNAAEVLDAAADLIEHAGWTSDHHWLPRPVSTAYDWFASSGSTAVFDNRPGPHPNFNAAGFCIVDAVVKVHPQGKFWGDPRQAWQSMKEPHCGALGKLMMDSIGPACDGYPDGLIAWNDKTNRTQAEVVDALRRAAQKATHDGSSNKNTQPSQG